MRSTNAFLYSLAVFELAPAATAADQNALETTEFMHSLAQQPMINYDQACRVVLLM